MPPTRSPIIRKKKPYKPTRTQLKSARAQQQYLTSQGEAVEKDANRKKRQAANVEREGQAAERQVHTRAVRQIAKKETRARDAENRRERRERKRVRRAIGAERATQRNVKVQALRKIADREETSRARAQLLKHSEDRQRKERYNELLKKAERGEYLEKSSTDAAVLSALEQATRPLHAIAGAAKKDVQEFKKHGIKGLVGHGSLKEAAKGIKNETKNTFSDVLKEAGVKNKAVAGAVGFGLDVVLDPTTYVTGGTASVVRQGAQTAAKQATKKAVKAGLTKEQAARMGERAAKQVAKKAKADSRGVSIRVAGKEVPGVRRGTAAVGRGVKKATDKAKPVRKTKEKVRHLAADFNPQITPDNISRESYREVRRATRTARSTTAREIAKTKMKAEGLRRRIGKADQEILDAIESGSLRKLSPEKREIAKRLQDDFKHARRLERRAGIDVKKRNNYVPHALREPLEKGEGIQSIGAKTIKPSFAKARKEQRTLAEIRKTDPGKYSEDAALLHANRMIESHVAANKAKLNRRLLDMGRRLKKGDEDALGDGEKVFNVKGSNIREVEDKRELQRFLTEGDGGRGGQYVVLNEQTVTRAIKNIIPASERTAIGGAIDKGQGWWKLIATVPNPGFHLRNLVGDAQNAYLAEPAHRVAVNTAKSARVLKAVGKQEEQIRKGGTSALKNKGVKVAGEKMSYDKLIKEAESVGAIRAGFISRELPELVKNAGKKGKLGRSSRAVRSVDRFLKDREDLFRLATYIGSRNRGLSPEKAAARAAKFHFDYADLTQLERTVLRRVAPFYTFSARNIPLQLTSFFAKPGKFAQYQKIREEFAKGFGLDLDEVEGNLTEYEQRSAPVPIKWKGKEFTLSFGPSGLPLTDLNEMPIGMDPGKWAEEWMERGLSMLTPLAKTPLEWYANYSFFFRDQLERDEGPLVPAPSWVAALPKGVRNKLGVVSDYLDKRSGKRVWAWPAKTDYFASVVPGPIAAANRLLTPSERPGQDTTNKLIGYGGLRATPVDAANAKISRLYDEKAKLTKKRAALNQRGITADNPTPEWRKLSAEIKRYEEDILRLKRKRGDKIVRGRGRPSKPGWVDSSSGSGTWVEPGSSGGTWVGP